MKKILLLIFLSCALFEAKAQIFGEISMYRAYFFELGQDMDKPMSELKYSLIKKGKEVEILNVDTADIFHATVRYREKEGLIHVTTLKDRYILLPFIPQIREEYVADMKKMNYVLGMNETEVAFMNGHNPEINESGNISHWNYTRVGSPLSFDFYNGRLCKVSNNGHMLKGYGTIYDLKMSRVEYPENVKETDGKIVSVDLPDKQGKEFTYEDEFFKITWFPGITSLMFRITNKSNASIKLPWDGMSFIDIYGNSERVVNGETRKIDINRAQPESVVPRGAKFSASAVLSSGKRLVNHDYLSPEEDVTEKGKEFSILFPVKVGDVTNEYLFIFEVEDVHILPMGDEI